MFVRVFVRVWSLVCQDPQFAAKPHVISCEDFEAVRQGVRSHLQGMPAEMDHDPLPNASKRMAHEGMSTGQAEW